MHTVDLPVGKRRCLFLCPSLHRAEDPPFTCAQCDNWQGVSWSWILPARGQRLLFHLAFLWHPVRTPSVQQSRRTPSWWGFLLLRDNLGGATVINLLGVDKELRIKAIWKHFYLRTLIANRGKSSWNLGYSGYSWSVVVPMDCLDVSQWGYNCA